jgi:ABC-type branched-subunit amino acid transport system substrate-binding protein
MVAILIISFGAGINAQGNDPILVGHLSYHTGPFADVGPWFDGITDFTINIINEDPPLGRDLVSIHQDIGTIGEARAARKLIELDGVEVLLNPAHGYLYYRDWLLEYLANNDRPLMPSVHGGAINREIGGTSAEPLFRGSPMDSAQSVAAIIQAQQAGAENIILVASEIEGHQLQKDAAASAAEELGLTILASIDIQSEMPSYQEEIGEIQSLQPDAVLVFTVLGDGATFIKDVADAGLSTTIIGTTEWQGEDFVEATTMDAIEQQTAVWIIAFTHTENPAWEYYEPLWENSEYADLAPAAVSYNLQYYDLLIVTALAIEAAGTTDASVWAEFVPLVAEAPGTIVYTYEEGIEALRNGEDIDYNGISGEMNYTDTGVVSGLFGVFEWASDSELELVATIDDSVVLELDK